MNIILYTKNDFESAKRSKKDLGHVDSNNNSIIEYLLDYGIEPYLGKLPEHNIRSITITEENESYYSLRDLENNKSYKLLIIDSPYNSCVNVFTQYYLESKIGCILKIKIDLRSSFVYRDWYSKALWDSKLNQVLLNSENYSGLKNPNFEYVFKLREEPLELIIKFITKAGFVLLQEARKDKKIYSSIFTFQNDILMLQTLL